jgi:uncharacterized protein
MAREVTENLGKQPLFLKAAWRKLLMANYITPPELLLPYLPPGTELDYWQDRCYASMVGFMFVDTEILGWKIPLHRNFEEINLRFYVRRKAGNQWRRGVVFIKEIVPKPAIAWVANTLYGERYVTRSMRHEWTQTAQLAQVCYDWKPFWGGAWNSLTATHAVQALPIPSGSEAEFITEHYWGYSKHGNRTMEYEVCHPRWNAYAVHDFAITGPIVQEYGTSFAKILQQTPSSVFLADGSDIEVRKGQLLCVD